LPFKAAPSLASAGIASEGQDIRKASCMLRIQIRWRKRELNNSNKSSMHLLLVSFCGL